MIFFDVNDFAYIVDVFAPIRVDFAGVGDDFSCNWADFAVCYAFF
jgi:hypothetical protein